MESAIAITLLSALLLQAAPAEPSDSRPVWVGVTSSVRFAVSETTLAPRERLESSLEPAEPQQAKLAPLVVSAVNPVKTDASTGTTEYEIRYVGLQAGDHDLRDYLKFSEGVNRQMVPVMLVRIADPLPPIHYGQLEVPPVLSSPPPREGLRQRTAAIAGIAWAAVLGGIGIAWWRKLHPRQTLVAAGAPEGDLAKKLLLAERKMLTPQGMAEVERMLLDRWRGELKLDDTQHSKLFVALEQDLRGRELLTEFSEWQRALRSGPARLPIPLRKYADGAASPTEVEESTP